MYVSSLQQRDQDVELIRQHTLRYYAFDCLVFNGACITKKDITKRYAVSYPRSAAHLWYDTYQSDIAAGSRAFRQSSESKSKLARVSTI